MAETDAAGPGSAGGPSSRALTREDVERLLAEAEREWDSLTPEEKARRKAESEKADREAFEEAYRSVRPRLEAIFEKARQAVSPALEAIRKATELPAVPQPPPWEMAQPPILNPNGRSEAFEEFLSRIEHARRPIDPEELRAVFADALRDAISSPPGRRTIARARREVKLADRLEADWASAAGRRFLIGETVRKLADHYGVSHGTLQGCRFWRDKVLPVRQKAERGSKTAARRDRLSRENF